MASTVVCEASSWIRESYDSVLTQVMTVLRTSLTAAQGNHRHIHTPDVSDSYTLAHTHTQLKAISVNSDLYRPNKIYLTTGKKWWMYFSSLFLCSSLLPLFLSFSQSLWMCQQGTKSEKERKWNETACVYTQLRNPLLSYYNYCRQILMTSVENINLKFTPAVLHMCMAERNDTWQSASKL